MGIAVGGPIGRGGLVRAPVQAVAPQLAAVLDNERRLRCEFQLKKATIPGQLSFDWVSHVIRSVFETGLTNECFLQL